MEELQTKIASVINTIKSKFIRLKYEFNMEIFGKIQDLNVTHLNAQSLEKSELATGTILLPVSNFVLIREAVKKS